MIHYTDGELGIGEEIKTGDLVSQRFQYSYDWPMDTLGIVEDINPGIKGTVLVMWIGLHWMGSHTRRLMYPNELTLVRRDANRLLTWA